MPTSRRPLNPFSNYLEGTCMSMFQSISATAPQGYYVNKGNV